MSHTNKAPHLHATRPSRAAAWLLCGPGLLASLPLLAAAPAAPTGAGWNLVIAIMVLVFALASAVLNLAAWRQWQGRWRTAALFPMALLLAWVALLVVDQMDGQSAHPLWALELFAWAMINMVYMVAVMTVKRILERADREESGSA